MIMGELVDPAVPRIDLRAARLPQGATVDCLEWTIDGPCAAPTPADSWDATGYHCVSYVHGRFGGRWVERLYYASSAGWTDITGPYSIGFLEWDGSEWVRVIGYAESPDGVTGWTGRRIVAADGEFDAAVAHSGPLSTW
jgi:hypothetical protein